MGYKIYKYTFPNGKVYIGKTKTTIEQRAGTNGCRYGDNTLVGRAIRKYGWVNIVKEVLLDDLSKQDANEKEKEFIEYFNSMNSEFGYNLTCGGDGGAVIGHNVSIETREKIGLKNKQLLKGRKLPKEQIERMRMSLIGHVVTEETRNKIRNGVTGYKHTDEAKQKMSKNNCMRRQEIREKVSKSLRESGKRRAEKRLQTLKEKYPDGWKQTEESNKKRSLALKGIPKSEETKQKMRKPKSPEAIENMRKAQREAWKRRKLTRIGGT